MKIFKVVGLLGLVAFSLYYTEQISLAVKENDGLLEEIRRLESQYEVKGVNAYINDNTIIPGISGSIIDVDASYDIMKKYGSIFNDNLLQYKKIKPSISIENNLDKYIVSGNKNKKEVAIAFIVDEHDSIRNVIDILSIYEVEADFFIPEKWFDDNNDIITELVNKDHEIGLLDSSNIDYMNDIIKNQFNEDVICLTKDENSEFLDKCKSLGNYTIKPNIIIEKNPLTEVKNLLTSGAIIGIEVSDSLNTELASIIEYINSKGYEIEEIEEMIEE